MKMKMNINQIFMSPEAGKILDLIFYLFDD